MPKNKKQVSKDKKKLQKKVKVAASKASIVEGFMWDKPSTYNDKKNIADTVLRFPSDPYGDYGERKINRIQAKTNNNGNATKLAGWATLDEAKKNLQEYVSVLADYNGEEDFDSKVKYDLYHIRIERIGSAEVNTHVQHDIKVGEITPVDTNTLVVIGNEKKKAKKKIKKSAKGKIVEPVTEAKSPEADPEFTTPDLS
jgi:hypothetical protein